MEATQEQRYRELISIRTLDDVDSGAAVALTASLVDVSTDLERSEGLRHAIVLMGELLERDLPPKLAVHCHYSCGTATATAWQLSWGGEQMPGWDEEGVEAALRHYRKAVALTQNAGVPDQLRCRLLTNIANHYDQIGRCVEALDYWDRALAISPHFAMAIGNKGMALWRYAGHAGDAVHGTVLAHSAYVCLERALELGVDPHAEPGFSQQAEQIRTELPPELVEKDDVTREHSLGDSQAERDYRRWSLGNRLFLNPINDLGPMTMGADDALSLPSMSAPPTDGPHYFGFYNQMKQEFISARYLFYEGRTATEPHFADRATHLVNTLDYPEYCLSLEKQKCAFRMCYSLLDKIAFFLNDHLGLKIPEKKVKFGSLWYVSRRRERGLRPEFRGRPNQPLKGLFWLSKDLHASQAGDAAPLEPDAEDLSIIRNHLEHKYLKLHWLIPEDGWGSTENSTMAIGYDRLAHSVSRDDFEAKTLRMIKLARAALMYLAFAVHVEEARRRAERGGGEPLPIYLDSYDDEWKR